MAAGTWASFRRSTRKGYEPLFTKKTNLRAFIVGGVPPKQMMLFTKPFLTQAWSRTKGAMPEDVVALVSYGIPTDFYMTWVQGMAKDWEVPVNFVGDLDPLDVSVYLALRCQDADLRKPKKVVMPIAYKGIDDRWLGLCEQNFKPGTTFGKVCIPMEAVERRHFSIIEKLLGGDALQELVGPRSLSMLRSGIKLELEGASNPVFYRRSFPRLLREHILGRGAEIRRFL